MSSKVGLLGRATALVVAAAGYLVGSPGFALGTKRPAKPVLDAVGIPIMRGVFPCKGLCFGGKLLSLTYLSSNVIVRVALGGRLGLLVCGVVALLG
eukprot:7447679-Ditylum_brightwellii.AAC.1